MRYIVKHYYKAGAVEYQAGAVIEIDDPEYAAWLTRDMRGFLAPVASLPAPVPPVPEPVVPEPVRAPVPEPEPTLRKVRVKG